MVKVLQWFSLNSRLCKTEGCWVVRKCNSFAFLLKPCSSFWYPQKHDVPDARSQVVPWDTKGAAKCWSSESSNLPPSGHLLHSYPYLSLVKNVLSFRLGKFDLTNLNSWIFPISAWSCRLFLGFFICAATQAPLTWYPLVAHPIPWNQRLPKTSAASSWIYPPPRMSVTNRGLFIGIPY